jgi:hypothetical protein
MILVTGGLREPRLVKLEASAAYNLTVAQDIDTVRANAGKSQIGLPVQVRLNFTGTTPFLTLKMLVPSALIGG